MSRFKRYIYLIIVVVLVALLIGYNIMQTQITLKLKTFDESDKNYAKVTLALDESLESVIKKLEEQRVVYNIEDDKIFVDYYEEYEQYSLLFYQQKLGRVMIFNGPDGRKTLLPVGFDTRY